MSMGHVKSAKSLISEVNRIYEGADLSERDLTSSERTEIEGLLLEAKAQKGIEDLGRELGGGFSTLMGDGSGHQYGGSDPGSAFIASKGYKSIKNSGSRGQSWTSGMIDVGLGLKGTILEGTGSPGSGTGGALIPGPQYVPGIVDRMFQPLVLEALLLSGVATGPVVRHIVQGTATSGASGVAEAGLKPESTLAWSTVDSPVKKIATTISLSDEALDDAPAIASLINRTLAGFVRYESERQIIRGTAGGNEIQGLLTSRGVPIYAGGTAAGSKAVQLFKAANGMRGSAFVEPEWFVLDPSDYQEIRLLTDSAGQLLGGGPWTGPYGNGQSVGASGQVTGAQDYLWGKPVYVSSAIGAGTALVGNSQSAQVWNRGGLSVEASSNVGDNFIHNLSVIRAERRFALSVFRAGGYVEVRF